MDPYLDKFKHSWVFTALQLTQFWFTYKTFMKQYPVIISDKC